MTKVLLHLRTRLLAAKGRYCGFCGYCLDHVQHRRCPECGKRVTVDTSIFVKTTPRWRQCANSIGKVTVACIVVLLMVPFLVPVRAEYMRATPLVVDASRYYISLHEKSKRWGLWYVEPKSVLVTHSVLSLSANRLEVVDTISDVMSFRISIQIDWSKHEVLVVDRIGSMDVNGIAAYRLDHDDAVIRTVRNLLGTYMPDLQTHEIDDLVAILGSRIQPINERHIGSAVWRPAFTKRMSDGVTTEFGGTPLRPVDVCRGLQYASFGFVGVLWFLLLVIVLIFSNPRAG